TRWYRKRTFDMISKLKPKKKRFSARATAREFLAQYGPSKNSLHQEVYHFLKSCGEGERIRAAKKAKAVADIIVGDGLARYRGYTHGVGAAKHALSWYRTCDQIREGYEQGTKSRNALIELGCPASMLHVLTISDVLTRMADLNVEEIRRVLDKA